MVHYKVNFNSFLHKAHTKKLWLLLIFFTLTYFTVPAQNIYNLNIEKVPGEGLLNKRITCINQDMNGFIWFGTVEGLFIYDGYGYKAFRNMPGDTSALVNNEILCLYPDGDKLWIGTNGGLSFIAINTQRIKNIYNPENFIVNAVLNKDANSFWVGTSKGLFELNKKTLGWKRISAADKDFFIQGLSYDKKGLLYIATKNGFYKYNCATQASTYYNPRLAIYPANLSARAYEGALADDGAIWLSTWGMGLVKFDAGTGKFRSWVHQTENVREVPFNITCDLLKDDNGNIWIANRDGGLSIYNPKKNNFVNYPVEWGSDSKLAFPVIRLFKDKCGIIWIGTDNGLYKYDPHSTYLFKKNFLPGKNVEGLESHASPLVMLKDSMGKWWVGSYKGIYLFNNKTGALTGCNKAFGIASPSPVFNIVQVAKGKLWVTAKNSLVKVNEEIRHGQVFFKTEVFKSANITSNFTVLYRDNEKRIWLGTHSDGIYRFDPAAKKFISSRYAEKGIRNKIKQINAFYELNKDSLLIGGQGSGLFLLNTKNGGFQKIHWEDTEGLAPEPTINVIYRKENTLWIGTQNNGLWQTDLKLSQPVIKTLTDGLPSMAVTALTGDKQNNLWLLTNGAIVDYQLNTQKFTVFDENSAVENLDDVNSIIADDNDNIFIGCRGGIYNINSSNITKNKQPPKILIKNLKIFDQEFNVRQGDTIELKYNQNYFSLEYVALNYTRSRFNKYAYKMVGLDKKWIDAGPRRYVSYANLDEGTYTFNVKAANNDGFWNNVPATLILIIKPPFWHTWWFYLLIVFFTLGSVYMVYTYNMNQLRGRMRLRDKIARDLHDDIGSTLSGINIFSKIALNTLPSDQHSSRELLEKISDKTEKTMDALSDIVWSINTRNDGLDNFLRKAREYIAEALEAQGIQYEFVVGPGIDQLKIALESRKELYLIFKEAVCNASKYSGCTFMQIVMSRQKNTCTLSIRDNGKGFDINNITAGNGIYNMRQRAKLMNAQLVLDSRENKGTLILLTFRIPRFR